MADEAFELDCWLEGVRRGDENAARNLVEALGPLVLRIVRAHRARRMPEEDLCQEVFMNLFRRLDQYRAEAPFAHWVSRIAVNTCLDVLRREKVRPELRWADLSEGEVAMLETLRDQPDAECVIDQVSGRELRERLLGALPAQDRLLVDWLYMEQRTVPEVAAWTGWGLSKVKVRAHRARARLRKIWKNLMKEAE